VYVGLPFGVQGASPTYMLGYKYNPNYLII